MPPMDTTTTTGNAPGTATTDDTTAVPEAGVGTPVARVKVGERLTRLFEETMAQTVAYGILRR